MHSSINSHGIHRIRNTNCRQIIVPAADSNNVDVLIEIQTKANSAIFLIVNHFNVNHNQLNQCFSGFMGQLGWQNSHEIFAVYKFIFDCSVSSNFSSI